METTSTRNNITTTNNSYVNEVQRPGEGGAMIPAATTASTTRATLLAPAPRLVSPLSVAALRRSSPHTTPTRTLQLTEQERQQAKARDSQWSRRVTVESLQQRPRSNQRNRTPRRNESPLNPDEFRRGNDQNSDNTGVRFSDQQPRRITIRPGATGTVGSVLMPTRIQEQLPERSAKQGPSHRKVRRWNNDRFDTLAAEIKSSSRAAAQVLLKGMEDAHLFRAVYDPKDHKSESMTQFLENSKWHGLRERFFEGELPCPEWNSSLSKTRPLPPAAGEEMLYRIDSRLRRVVTKACQNSYPAARVVKTFETFVLESFGSSKAIDGKSALVSGWWHGILLEQPTITKRRVEKLMTAQFYFDPTNATGGFHRLLLHAVSQFHGLTAVSRMAQISIGEHKESRALSVTGSPTLETKFQLLDILSEEDKGAEVETLGSKLEEAWTVV
ncbi:hypothetical protein ACA910_000266 [Epithemia clementina (nom. ined.)]